MAGPSTLTVLADFVRARFGKSVNPDQPLLGEVVDSLGIFSLVEFIETTFGVTITDADLTTDNLRSLRTIEELIGRLRTSSQPSSA